MAADEKILRKAQKERMVCWGRHKKMVFWGRHKNLAPTKRGWFVGEGTKREDGLLRMVEDGLLGKAHDQLRAKPPPCTCTQGGHS